MSEREDETLLRLAESVVDGQPVDWQEESLSDDAPVARIRRLQILASIAGAFGMPPDAPKPDGGTLFRWGRLAILEKIGEGVYGEVYRGWDDALEREVAVKFLRDRPGLAAAHVLHEGRHLARIRHPGVVSVYGAEQLEGRFGVWMEYVRGRTLEDLLQEQGAFDSRETIRIGLDVCRALAAVHAAGLVHRDVKTRNIVRESSGRTVLMDLGAGVDATAGEQTYDLAGTPIYLAPEVLQGQPASPRSDLYGLGVVLYRLVTGGYPIAGTDLEALRNAHARGEARPLREARPGLPAPFMRVVERALAADPARRFTSAEEMERALVAALDAPRRARRRVVIGVVAAAAIVVAGAAVLAYRARGPASAPVTGRPAVAVADVAHGVDDGELDAIAGMLVTSLEQPRSLSILTRSRMNDVLAQAGRRGVLRIDRALALEAGRRVGAAAVLLPSVRTAGRGYHVELEAVEPRRGRTLFRATAEAATKADLPASVDTLSSRVRAALDPERGDGGPVVRPVAEITTASLGAYHHYDRAERLIDRGQMRDARTQLDSALARDPTFALAHARLAYVCWWLTDPVCEREQLAKAFALIDRIPERQRFHLRAQGAMADRQGLEAARAILLEMERFYPHDKEMLYDIGDYSSHLNEFPTAIQYLERVVAMDGGFVRALQHLARVYRDMGDHDRSLEWARRYAAADSSWESSALLGNALIASGDASTGMKILRRGRERTPERSSDVTTDMARAQSYAGRAADGLHQYERLIAAAPTDLARGELLQGRAGLHIHRGAYREAVTDLERAANLARRAREPVAEAIARMDAATLHLVGRDDPQAAFAQVRRCAELEASITYQGVYFHYWQYWGGRFKLHLLNGEHAPAESLARQKFTADKWYGPYVAAYLHAARGECAQAEAAASRVLEWGPAAENIPLLYFLARCRSEQGRADDALALLARLQALHGPLTLGTPYYAKGLLLSARLHERNGDRRRAAETYSRLMELWRHADGDLPDHVEASRRMEVLAPLLASTP